MEGKKTMKRVDNARTYWEYRLKTCHESLEHFRELDERYPGCGYDRIAEFHEKEVNNAKLHLA